MANNKKRVLSLLMAAVMMLSALPMNAYAIDWSGIAGSIVGNTLGELVCEKQEVSHTADCYEHTEACYHKHSEPVYVPVLGLVSGCEYACTEHTHSIENGCPVENCDAHAHSADCCNVEKHDHSVLCCSRELHEHSWVGGCYKLTCTKSIGWTHWAHTGGCYSDEKICTKESHLHTEGCVYDKCGKTAHDHTSGCNYACGISTEHTHDADCYSCEIAVHTHSDECERTCGKTGALECNGKESELVCTNELHHKHSLENGCYMSTEAVRNAVYKATGVVIEDPVELGAVLSTIIKCMTGSGACYVDYKVVPVSPYLELSLVLCEEHFCSICHRMNAGYCTCVEITFTNIYNVAENSQTVKVAAGTAAGAIAPHADMTDYEFMGWFDENGNEFNASTVYDADITFTASYRALGEAEKLVNTIEFIRNNFDLGTEIGRFITMITNGEVTKEKVLSEKSTAVATVTAALLTSLVTGQLTQEQVGEINDLMNQGDEYVVMVAEWLWPEDAVEMPNLEEILANIDREKLAAEIKDMIAEYYGVEFTEEWINENRALAEQYIIECLREVKSITEQQKAALLEQIAQEKAEAREFINNLVSEIRAQIKAEIENAKDYVKAVLADREKGLKIGKAVAMITGLNNEKASEKGVLVKAALVSAIRMSGLDQKSQDAIIALMNSGDNGVVQVINWLWPVYTVNFIVDGTIVESDVAEHGTMPSFDGEEPTKAADAQYTYTFTGWNAEFAPVTGSVNYTAVFSKTVNEYTIIFKNEDGAVLDTQTVAYGATPVYAGATPAKAADAQYTYTFNGWDAVIVPVTSDAVYTATYSSTVNKYTVTFVNYDGTELQSSEVEYGVLPAYTGIPTKAGDDQYSYAFDGWTTEIVAVTGDATYTAKFAESVNKYTVTFVNYDGTELQSSEVAYGEIPTYNGAEPTKAATDESTYTFAGWTPEVNVVTGTATYKATYTESARVYTFTLDLSEGGKLVGDWATKTPISSENNVFVFEYTYGTGVTLPTTNKNKCLDRTGYNGFTWTIKGGADDVTAIGKTQTGDLCLVPNWQAKENTYEAELVDKANPKTVVAPRRIDKNTKSGNTYGKVIHPSAAYDSGVYPTFNPELLTTKVWNTLKVSGVTYTHGVGSGSDYYEFTPDFVKPAGKGTQYYLIYGDVSYFHTVTLVVDGVETKVSVEHGEKLDTAALAEQFVKRGFDLVWTDKDGNTFDVDTAINGSMTLTAKWEEAQLAEWTLKAYVGTGDLNVYDKGQWTPVDHKGKIYNVKHYAAYGPKNTVISENDFESYSVNVPEKVKLDGITYAKTTDVESATENDFYVIDNVTFVTQYNRNDIYCMYMMMNHVILYHTVTLNVDGVEYKIPVVRGEKLDTTEIADQLVKRGFDLVWTDKDGNTFDVDTAINESMTLEAKWVVKKVDAKLRIFVGFGESGTDKTANWKEAGAGKIFGANVCESYKNWGKSSTIMQEGEYSSYTGTAGSVVFDGTKYYNGTDEASRIGGDFYVIMSETLVACKSEYHLDCYAEFYHSVVFNVDGQYISVPVMHGHAVEVPAEYKNLKWNIDLTNITSSVMATPVY